MNLFNFDINTFLLFTMVFVRMSALVFTMPIIGATTVPVPAKVGLSALTSMIITSTVELPPLDLSMSVWKFSLMLTGEVAIGLILGFATQLIFTAVQLAGQIIGFQMGFAIVNVMDPATQSQISITAQFQNIMALMIFLAINGHHFLFAAGAKSFELIPILAFSPSPAIVEMVIELTKNVFITAIKLGAPIMATLFFLNVGLGLVARTVPQMNVFIVGFPLQIALGLLMLGATAPIFMAVFQHSFTALYADLTLLMRLM